MPVFHPGDQLGLLIAAIWLVIVLFGLALTVFWVVEIVDVLRREFADANMKIVWLLVVIFLHGLGAIIYYFVGKPTGRLPGQVG